MPTAPALMSLQVSAGDTETPIGERLGANFKIVNMISCIVISLIPFKAII